MKLHKFTCTECPTQPFYTTFEPKFDPPATCPCCGQATTVKYQEKVVMREVVKRVGQSEVA
jgi:hypothetical protein